MNSMNRKPGRPRKNWQDIIQRDWKDIGLTWDEASELAHSRSSWRQLVAQCVFDTGWTQVRIRIRPFNILFSFSVEISASFAKHWNPIWPKTIKYVFFLVLKAACWLVNDAVLDVSDLFNFYVGYNFLCRLQYLNDLLSSYNRSYRDTYRFKIEGFLAHSVQSSYLLNFVI